MGNTTPAKTVQRADIMRYFRKHRGETVWVDDLLPLYDGKPDANVVTTREQRINYHIRMLRKDGHHIETIYKGRAWRYGTPKAENTGEDLAPSQPQPQPKKPTLGVIELVTVGGETIALLSDGKLYKLQEI